MKLANHGAFESGEVETHFIELHKDSLFINPNDALLTEAAYDVAKHGAAIAAACLCEMEHVATKEHAPGNPNVNTVCKRHKLVLEALIYL